MVAQHEKLIKQEVLRRVGADHALFDDLVQEGRVAVWGVQDKLDASLPLDKQRAYIRQAIRWRIGKAYLRWLMETFLVSGKSLRKNEAYFDRVDYNLPDWKRDNVPDSEALSEASFADRLALVKVVSALRETAETEKEKEAIEGFLEGKSSREIGKAIGRSHQGVLNMQKALFVKAKQLLANKQKQKCKN